MVSVGHLVHLEVVALVQVYASTLAKQNFETSSPVAAAVHWVQVAAAPTPLRKYPGWQAVQTAPVVGSAQVDKVLHPAGRVQPENP